ncbi:serine--tRNA ligase [Candidatus Desantisbacteria bacterium CG_4_10_14_0_8_um_filter_48_22]|uniref:Serine--tRNA ligase n=1 Tax=Candidatus Desantisbacteria bacterium CG_4_10_14_0_8_um_filter_48_22 TaxID=1974543 RepID=A0A2M7SFH4_9BACT|nr:MAG: serine--tRNA ligase [Candidatus Desantisbacteria bacterium CG1_02_49_89]PIV56183.1 MAG: serine--tRNA ligase [Candidatus Desantisbacteria bacterium CG02_land_8_20_14_3_00_49_13]PIZ18282.1 MAG: serine--tRNA ligase [Candidatus Desantisbacteria bacterium CG_4_10_14_0_8_um_filter_48_22]PJB27322.1 MAG: serine--tRNA ligase [Candidatus Desantisbacteria bacterium CG_4_9_14_3_um_filter_50_7]
MIDMKFIRENAELIRKNLQDRGNKLNLDELLGMDEERRKLIKKAEELKFKRNVDSEKIAQLKKEKKDADALIKEMKEIGDEIKKLDGELGVYEKKVNDMLLLIPNIPDPSVPVSTDPKDNREVRTWGKKPEFDFQPRPHWDIGEALGILDLGRASKITGAHFAIYKGLGAKLERALINFMLDLHIDKHGYKEIWPPILVNRGCITGTGQLPKYEEDMYRCDLDDIFPIPTAEVPLTGFHKDEVLEEKDLPVYYTAYTPCFRREAGSYGKDTRGLLRVHQFDKVEMVKLTKPEDSDAEHEKMVQNAEEVIQLLKLPYRVILLCTVEIGFSARKCYDLEIWAPAQNRWLESSSCSNCGDFQARRLNIRYRKKDGKTELVHTLNGSGIALARTFAAILENYQQKDGSVIVPDVLKPYMGGVDVIK